MCSNYTNSETIWFITDLWRAFFSTRSLSFYCCRRCRVMELNIIFGSAWIECAKERKRVRRGRELWMNGGIIYWVVIFLSSLHPSLIHLPSACRVWVGNSANGYWKNILWISSWNRTFLCSSVALKFPIIHYKLQESFTQHEI